MKTSEVVTSFLCYKGRICLVKRSPDVGTYQGRFSGISGYLEGDPSMHFMVEIQEETGLTPYEYRLIRRAQPFEIIDEDMDRKWIVHPFACEVQDPSKIDLDWENTDLQWVYPMEMKDLDTVPKLFEVYETVSDLPLKEMVTRHTEEIRANHKDGSRQIAIECMKFMDSLVKKTNAKAGDILVGDMEYAIAEVSMARPSMAIIATSCALLKRDLHRLKTERIEAVKKQISSIIDVHINDMKGAASKAISHLREIIPQGARLMMHSYSSSLVEAMEILKDMGCSLIITESRPGLEGRRLAEIAAAQGIDVRIVTDACAGLALDESDLVLMGVDAIEMDGTVINKAGSSLIAMAAKARGIKVFFAGETRKISGMPGDISPEKNDPAEVWEDAPEGIIVSNVYFDRTSPRYISGILLEFGVVEPYQIKRIQEECIAINNPFDQ